MDEVRIGERSISNMLLPSVIISCWKSEAPGWSGAYLSRTSNSGQKKKWTDRVDMIGLDRKICKNSMVLV